MYTLWKVLNLDEIFEQSKLIKIDDKNRTLIRKCSLIFDTTALKAQRKKTKDKINVNLSSFP
jgi:hypothetical protein